MFPFVRQRDNMQCGAACLCMICRFYGYRVSLPNISGVCSPTAEGVSLLGIKESAESFGFEAVPCRIALKNLCADTLPCIMHWNQNHFVVLYKIKGNNFYIADSGRGFYRCDRSEFTTRWANAPGQEPAGFALFLKPTEHMSFPEDNTDEHAHSFRFLMRYLSDYRKQMVMVLLGLLLGCVLQLILPFLTQAVVDAGIRNKDISLIWLILLGDHASLIARRGAYYNLVRNQLELGI